MSSWILLGALLITLTRHVSGCSGQSLQPQIEAELKSSGSRILLEISNSGSVSVPLTLVISLGTDTEMAEAGRVDLRLGAQRIESYQLRGLPQSPTAPTHYILFIHSNINRVDSPPDLSKNRSGELPSAVVRVAPGRKAEEAGSLLLYRHAALRASSDQLPGGFLTVTPTKSTKREARLSATRGTEATETPADQTRYENFVPTTEVQLQARLLAGTDDPEIPILAFELFTERPILDAILEIRIGKFDARKQINISGQSLVQFELPRNIDSGDEEVSIHYRLASRERRTLLEGDLPLAKLIEDDGITLSDIQFDQPSYPAGASVRMILQLNGRSRSGFTIEITVRDGRGQLFHRDQQLFQPGGNETAIPFNFNIPGDLEGPVVVEYRILNNRTSALYDAGDRSFPIVN